MNIDWAETGNGIAPVPAENPQLYRLLELFVEEIARGV